MVGRNQGMRSLIGYGRRIVGFHVKNSMLVEDFL